MVKSSNIKHETRRETSNKICMGFTWKKTVKISWLGRLNIVKMSIFLIIDSLLKFQTPL